MKYRIRAIWGQTSQNADDGQGPNTDDSSANTNADDSSTKGSKGDKGGDQGETFSRQYVEDLRRESASYRTKASGFESQIKQLTKDLNDIKGKTQTEEEQKAERLKQLEDMLPNKDKEIRQLRAQVIAGDLGIVDPEVAATLVDWSRIDAGEDMKKVFQDLLEAKPYLKRAETQQGNGAGSQNSDSTNDSSNANANGTNGNNGATSQGQNSAAAGNTTSAGQSSSSQRGATSFTRADLAKMTPEQVVELLGPNAEGPLGKALAEGRVT